MAEKHEYLTAQNKGEKLGQWLAECLQIRGRRPYELNPAGAAVLAIDMQDYFLDEASHAYVPSGPMIIPAVNRLIDWARANRRPVILTRHINKPDPADMMARWWGGAIAENTPVARLNHRLAIDASKVTAEQAIQEIETGIWVLTKHYYSAFWETPLDAILRQQGVGQVIIAGVMTHLCCESTAREAFMRGYEVVVAADATASYTEALHVGSLRAIAHGFGLCVGSDEILSWAAK